MAKKRWKVGQPAGLVMTMRSAAGSIVRRTVFLLVPHPPLVQRLVAERSIWPEHDHVLVSLAGGRWSWPGSRDAARLRGRVLQHGRAG